MTTSTAAKTFAKARAQLLAATNGKAPSLEDQAWVFTSNQHIQSLENLSTLTATDAGVAAQGSASAATTRAWQPSVPRCCCSCCRSCWPSTRPGRSPVRCAA